MSMLGFNYKTEPILGQALTIEIDSHPDNWNGWPAVLNINGINLIPNGNKEMIIGSFHFLKMNQNKLCCLLRERFMKI